MAELDPEKVGRSGFDPGTGSPLSQEVRNALLKKSTVDRSVFRNELQESENRKRDIDNQNVRVVQSQEQAILGFSSNIQALRNDIGKLGGGLASIALLLQKDNAEYVSNTKAEQENERRLAEQKVRIGKESAIEEKIQSAVTEPVQRLVPKVNDVFGRIGSALGILFGGWLTNQVVQAIKASEEGNTKLFNDIKFNILKHLAIVGGGLFAIRAGFSLVKRTIGSIARGLTRLLIAKPLAIAAALLPRIPTPTLPGGGRNPSGPKPGGNRGLGLIGNLAGLVNSFLNFKNKENVDGIMQLLGVLLPAVGPLAIVKGLINAGVLADQIAEVFGSNLFGKDPNISKIKEAAEKEAAKNKPTTSSKPTSSPGPEPTSSTKPTSSPAPAPALPAESVSAPPSAPAPALPAAQPQTPMMGEQKPPTSAPSPEMVSQFEQAWQYRNNPFARGKIEGAWDKMSPDQKQQAKDWATSKGYNWSEMKLQDPTPATTSQTKSQIPEATLTPAQVSIPEKPPTQVGQLPEPKPSLTMIKTSSAQQQQPNPPLTNGPLTDVPLINSANPDNFYVLYSQLNYNVVM